MKTIVFLYSVTDSLYPFKKAFNCQSAAERSLKWASLFSDGGVFLAVNSKTASFAAEASSSRGIKADLIQKEEWNCRELLASLADCCSKTKADCVLVAPLSAPFLDAELTKKLLSSHEKYFAEYTFADGYPKALAPEVIGAGSVSILKSLVEGKSCELLPLDGDTLMNALKTDINSFEIESVLSEEDWRQYRLDFTTDLKRNFLSCLALFEEASAKNDFSAAFLSKTASASAKVQCTVPAFYTFQMTDACSSKLAYSPLSCKKSSECLMSLSDFSSSLKQIEELSEDAVISLGFYSEPLLHPEFLNFVGECLSHKKLSLLVETDGSLVNEDLCKKIRDLPGSEKITWIVLLDAFSPEVYGLLHQAGGDASPEKLFATASSSVELLNSFFPKKTYPQMVRMNANEKELESFYRFWHSSESPSGGNVIIQKYDSFCSVLSDEKPADLSPLVRMPCWHVKRDMVILADGSIPLCRERVTAERSVHLNDGIENAWKKIQEEVPAQIAGNYCELCRKCDEYYTFNF